MSFRVGARLGHYKVIAKLGEGGMGETWEATDTNLNRVPRGGHRPTEGAAALGTTATGATHVLPLTPLASPDDPCPMPSRPRGGLVALSIPLA